jgi:5-methylthioadenosine/S-adenosylhomocysteine deaminase
VLDNHAIAISNGRIIAILPEAQALEKFSPAAHQKFSHHVLLPGLINAHTHAAMTLMRGLADDLPLMEWLNQHIWPAEARWVSEEYVRDGTALAMIEMLRGGITCFNDMYFFPDVIAGVVRDSGMRAVIGLITIDFPSAWAKDAQDYLDKATALHDQLQDIPLLHFALAPHAPYTVSAVWLEKIRDLANERDLPIHMHVHETAAEVEQWQQQHAKRPLQYLDELGLLSPRLAAVHMTQLSAAEITRLSETGVNVLHCPESNLKLASGFSPVAAMVAAGINVAIGTDGAASNNDLDMFGEMRTAAILAKAVAADAAALPAHQVLRMATLNGARALGLDAEIGSLEAGKQADIIAVDLAAAESQPVYHPISQLIYATGRHQVSDVWVAGRQLLQNRRLLSLDSDAVLSRVHDCSRK